MPCTRRKRLPWCWSPVGRLLSFFLMLLRRGYLLFAIWRIYGLIRQHVVLCFGHGCVEVLRGVRVKWSYHVLVLSFSEAVVKATIAISSLQVPTSSLSMLKRLIYSLRFSHFFWETKRRQAEFFFRFLLEVNWLQNAYARSLNEVMVVSRWTIPCFPKFPWSCLERHAHEWFSSSLELFGGPIFLKMKFGSPILSEHSRDEILNSGSGVLMKLVAKGESSFESKRFLLSLQRVASPCGALFLVRH